MKNVKSLTHFNDRRVFLDNLWKTEEFQKASKDSSSSIYKLEQDFLKYPRIVADYTDQHIEHAHFYSWMNVLMLRTYPNKTIQDLYYLHELKHITSMHYQSMSFDNWYQKMVDNETDAALYSEVLIYNELPIRAKSFNFPIWFDQVAPEVFNDINHLKTLRLQSMTNPKNPVEEVLNQYYINNQTWGEVWRKNFDNVEVHMWEFYAIAAVKSLDIDFEDMAVNLHLEWLKYYSTDDIPFKEEAVGFADSYDQLKKRTKT